MNPADDVFRAYDEGRAALFVSGRSLYDFVVDAEGKIRPVIEVIRREARGRYGMHVMAYSMAGGLDWDASGLGDERDRKTIETALRAHHLIDIPQDQNEVIRVIRGISSLSRTPVSGLKWADGREMHFGFLFEFSEHLTPGSLTNGTQTEAQLVAIELAHITSQSLALRKSGNLVLFHGRDGLIDELVSCALHHVQLRQPDRDEKRAFIGAAAAIYPEAKLESGLEIDSVAHLTTNTPNRGLEALLRASHRSGRLISAKELAQQKSRDVEELSERTLTVLDTSRVEGLELFGVNIEKPRRILERFSEALMRGDAAMPANVLLAGAPGTGKTDLAVLAARNANAAAYRMENPKDPFVGGTERKVKKQQKALKEWAPNVALVDEISEALPLERSDFDGDSGASRAVMAELLTALSDETRRGKSLLIATTNVPWRMGAAMRSRFTIIPVLQPLARDMAGIIIAIARRTFPTAVIDLADKRIKEAADIFHEKGANARHIRSALSNALLLHGKLDADAILFAAQDLSASADSLSAVYADLWAIEMCTSRSFLPWAECPQSYDFPGYLEGIVDPETGNIDRLALARRIEELKPHANV
jgi:AAA+ superfamily predicted ATPase